MFVRVPVGLNLKIPRVGTVQACRVTVTVHGHPIMAQSYVQKFAKPVGLDDPMDRWHSTAWFNYTPVQNFTVTQISLISLTPFSM